MSSSSKASRRCAASVSSRSRGRCEAVRASARSGRPSWWRSRAGSGSGRKRTRGSTLSTSARRRYEGRSSLPRYSGTRPTVCRPAPPTSVRATRNASRELAAPVQEQLGARRKLRQVRLVEPDGGLPHALAVDDDALDELQVPAPGRAHADALEGAPYGCLLACGEVAEAPDLLPVEVRARDVLGEVADGADAELAQPFGDLRADPGDRLDGGVGVDAWAPGGRCVAASREPGGRGGYGSPSQ